MGIVKRLAASAAIFACVAIPTLTPTPAQAWWHAGWNWHGGWGGGFGWHPGWGWRGGVYVGVPAITVGAPVYPAYPYAGYPYGAYAYPGYADGGWRWAPGYWGTGHVWVGRPLGKVDADKHSAARPERCSGPGAISRFNMLLWRGHQWLVDKRTIRIDRGCAAHKFFGSFFKK